ncbi:unnamed protein product [Acanthoscelides obtectus]
MSFLQ